MASTSFVLLPTGILQLHRPSYPYAFAHSASSSKLPRVVSTGKIIGKCRAKDDVSYGDARVKESVKENAIVKTAWYASEALGVVVSFFRSLSTRGLSFSPPFEAESYNQKPSQVDAVESVCREEVVSTIKEDYRRAYFVTGNLTTSIYEEDCEFADPAGSFKGLMRFKRNCTNFGYLLEKSNMKLMKWEDFEDKGIGYWRFICVLAFPWRPILSATGHTEYFYDSHSGKIGRYLSRALKLILGVTSILEI
eukprot:TRINITY_DN116_c0_g1_i1.p1 TRINITY_DN116_c0_g1~~TRINITY_DN116_c0_g1_i1.p1  ORF type:complete len:250 (+),score=27.98 TRINITY_DN116_c0_g1_i1:131-880(+)